MSEILVVETGQLTPASRRELKKAGIVVAEVADLAKATFLRSSEVVSQDDMVWALLDALCRHGDKYGESKGHTQREALSQNLLKVVLDARKRVAES